MNPAKFFKLSISFRCSVTTAVLLCFLVFPSPIICFKKKPKYADTSSGEDVCECSPTPNGERVCTTTKGSQCNETLPSKRPTKLLLVQVIFRHGDRAPVFSYPNDPLKNSSAFKGLERKGKLTKQGKIDGYELGRFIHYRYEDHLAEILIPEQLYALSSQVERAMMTGQTVLAGIFPPCSDILEGCDGRWSREIKWQPLPLYTISPKHDKLLNVRMENCPRYAREFDKVMNCKLMQDFISSQEETFQHLQKHTGIPKVNVTNAHQVYDTLLVEDIKLLRLPEWTKKVYPEPLKTIHDYGLQVLSANRQMMKFYGGPLLKQVLTNMKKSISRERCPEKHTEELYPKKLYLYSGHDTTIAAFLNTLDIFELHHPPYTAAIMVELHQAIRKNGEGKISDNDFFVKVFYRNTTRAAPTEMIIPDCGNPCTLSKLEGQVRDLLISNWEKECHKLDWLSLIYAPFSFVWDFFARIFRGNWFWSRKNCCSGYGEPDYYD